MVTLIFLVCGIIFVILLGVVLFVWKKHHSQNQSVSEKHQDDVRTVMKITANDCVTPSVCLCSLSAFGLPESEREWYSRLIGMDTSNPATRSKNQHDKWFQNNVDFICTKLNGVSFIEHFGYVEEAFWKCVSEPQLNLQFQRWIISVYHNEYSGKYHLNFSNLLYSFIRKYDFLPQIKEIFMHDARFTAVRKRYLQYHPLV